MVTDFVKHPIGSREYRNQKKKLTTILLQDFLREERNKLVKKNIPENIIEFMVYSLSMNKANKEIENFVLSTKSIVKEEEEIN